MECRPTSKFGTVVPVEHGEELYELSYRSSGGITHVPEAVYILLEEQCFVGYVQSTHHYWNSGIENDGSSFRIDVHIEFSEWRVVTPGNSSTHQHDLLNL